MSSPHSNTAEEGLNVTEDLDSRLRDLESRPSGDLRFAVGDEVIALVTEGWVYGRITLHWYHDSSFSDPNHSVPYQIQLGPRRFIFCSHDENGLVRAATAANFEATGAQRHSTALADWEITENDSNIAEDAYVTVPESSVRKANSGDLRFAVGDEVIALATTGRISRTWVHGRITRLWYNDPTWINYRRVPYQIQLLRPPHEFIWCGSDDDDLVQAATAANFEATGSRRELYSVLESLCSCPCCGDDDCNKGNSIIDRMRRKLSKRNSTIKGACHCDRSSANQGGVVDANAEAAHLDEVLLWNDLRSQEATTPRSKKKSKKTKRAGAKTSSSQPQPQSPSTTVQVIRDCLDAQFVAASEPADCDIHELAHSMMGPLDRPRLSLKPDIRSSIIQMCLSHAQTRGMGTAAF